jgi:hypothetical protein
VTPALLVARGILRRHASTVLLLGLIAGLTGGVVVGGATLARRTATAYSRLQDATRADDARGSVLGPDQRATIAMGERFGELPSVDSARTSPVAVARVVADEVVFIGIVAGPTGDEQPLQPVVVEGRAPRADSVDEVMFVESVARDFGIRPGARFTLQFLTRDEYYSFGAEEPQEGNGPRLDVEVVGLVRVPGDVSPPVFSSAAMASRVPDAFQAGAALFLQLRDGASLDEVRGLVDELNEEVELPPAAAEFAPADVASTADAADAAATTTRVLVTGLAVFTAVAGVAGLLALGQAMARHHAASSADQAVEAALGMSRRTRVIARVVALVPVAFLGAAMTAAGGVVASAIEPLGGVRFFEPNPGLHVNALIVMVGCAVILVVTLGLGAFTALRAHAPRGRPIAPLRQAGIVQRLAALGGRPPVVVGLRYALERGAGRTAVPVLSSIGAVMLGVAGVASVVVFAASLHRLVTTPVRFGWPAEIEISDAEDTVIDTLVDDPRLDVVVGGDAASVRIEGESVPAISLRSEKGQLEWELISGRPPATPDEIVLGTRVADRLDKGAGDTVVLASADGDRDVAVVGVAVLPTFGGTALGRNVALTEEGLDRFAQSDPFPEATVSPLANEQIAAVRDELAARYEVSSVELPADVRNLDELGGIPTVLGAFLGLLAVVALAHALIVAARRRARDVAMLRVLGFTPRQTQSSFVVMAVTTALGGLLPGVPLGIALGSTVWRIVAEGAAVRGDALLAVGPLVIVAAGTLVVALALATWPAWRASRTRPARTLHSE